jgi:precorrin-2 dehydrogenase/sirohydrochlorin ferrochelatase
MLDLAGRTVLVVGAGPIATRKVEGLVREGATVRVVAPDVSADMEAVLAAHARSVTVERRRYTPSDLTGVRLVITATNDLSVQQAVFDDSERLGIWVNAADDPDRCAFILPAVHRQGVVTIAVSTSGASPALAQWLRDRLRDALPEHLEELVRELSERRLAMKATGASTELMDWRPVIEELRSRAAERASSGRPDSTAEHDDGAD